MDRLNSLDDGGFLIDSESQNSPNISLSYSLENEISENCESELFPGLLDINKTTEVEVSQQVDDDAKSSIKSDSDMTDMTDEESHSQKDIQSQCNKLIYRCKLCNKGFLQQFFLKTHMKKIHSKAPSIKIQCTECSKSYTNKFNLKQHFRVHTGEKPFHCSYCKKGFVRKDYMETHLKKAHLKCSQPKIHSEELDDNGDTISSDEFEELNPIAPQIEKKTFKCDECDKNFTNQDDLYLHLKTHSGGKNYQCNYCDKSFKCNEELKIHLKTHTREKSYQCNECDVLFTGHEELKLHLITHTREKPYKCDECDKLYPRREELIQHLQTHTGVKTHKCGECEKSFTGQEELRLHLKTHIWDKCDKCASGNCDLKEHQKQNMEGKQFYCSYCDNKRHFKTKLRLSGHLWDAHRIKINIGDKTWSCELCDKLFVTDLDFEAHLTIHTLEKSSQPCSSPVLRPSQLTVDTRDARSQNRVKRKLDTQMQIKSAKELINLKNQGQRPNLGAKVQTRPLNSPVWKYYNRVVSSEDSKLFVGAKCNLCMLTLSYTGGTSTLLKHLRFKHPIDYQSILSSSEFEKNQLTMSKYVHAIQKEKWARGSEESNLYDNKIALFIISSSSTLSIVDSKEFRDILVPAYTPVCRKTFKENIIFPLAHETKKVLQYKLANETEFFAVSTDCWSSGSHDPYTHVSVHYIDENFNLLRVHLGVLPNTGSHTAENLKNLLEGPNGILTLYGLSNKPHTYVTDNASNATAAFEGNGENMWFGCMAHTINLTVKAGMAHHKVKHVAKACKALVSYINASNVARHHLKEFQEFLDFENILTVIQEVDTRWNSIKHMFDRLIILRRALIPALISENREDLVNSMDFSDWDFIEALSAFLAPFEELTEVLSGDKYLTIIYASGTLRAIQKHLEKNQHDSKSMLEVKDLMTKDFKMRYQTQELKKIITVTKILDPRCSIKRKCAKSSELLLSQETIRINNLELRENEIIPCTEGQELHNISSIMNKSSSSLFSVPSTSKSSTVSSSILDTSTPKINNEKYKSSSTGKKIYYEHFDRNYIENNTGEKLYQCQSCALEFQLEKDYNAHIVRHIEGKEKKSKDHSAIMQEIMASSDEEENDSQTPSNDLEKQVNLEISQYKALLCSSLDSEKEFDILSWWKSMSTQFPRLSKTAKYYLCIPATSATSERSFKIANDIITKKRNRLKPDTVEKLTFLKNNFIYIPEYTQKY